MLCCLLVVFTELVLSTSNNDHGRGSSLTVDCIRENRTEFSNSQSIEQDSLNNKVTSVEKVVSKQFRRVETPVFSNYSGLLRANQLLPHPSTKRPDYLPRLWANCVFPQSLASKHIGDDGEEEQLSISDSCNEVVLEPKHIFNKLSDNRSESDSTKRDESDKTEEKQEVSSSSEDITYFDYGYIDQTPELKTASNYYDKKICANLLGNLPDNYYKSQGYISMDEIARKVREDYFKEEDMYKLSQPTGGLQSLKANDKPECRETFYKQQQGCGMAFQHLYLAQGEHQGYNREKPRQEGVLKWKYQPKAGNWPQNHSSTGQRREGFTDSKCSQKTGEKHRERDCERSRRDGYERWEQSLRPENWHQNHSSTGQRRDGFTDSKCLQKAGEKHRERDCERSRRDGYEWWEQPPRFRNWGQRREDFTDSNYSQKAGERHWVYGPERPRRDSCVRLEHPPRPGNWGQRREEFTDLNYSQKAGEKGQGCSYERSKQEYYKDSKLPPRFLSKQKTCRSNKQQFNKNY